MHFHDDDHITHTTHTRMYAHMHARAPTCMQAYLELYDGLVDWDVFACAYIHTCVQMYIYTYIQDYVMAFMMGTHSRLGADSPVLLLDPLVAACIGQIIIADKW